RSAFGFPPFTHIVKFTFSGKDEEKVIQAANLYQSAVQSKLPENYICHPVIPAAHIKIKDDYRYQFLVRGPAVTPVRAAITFAELHAKPASTISRFINVDPTSTFF